MNYKVIYNEVDLQRKDRLKLYGHPYSLSVTLLLRNGYNSSKGNNTEIIRRQLWKD